jgi:hypothetical protein
MDERQKVVPATSMTRNVFVISSSEKGILHLGMNKGNR